MLNFFCYTFVYYKSTLRKYFKIKICIFIINIITKLENHQITIQALE